MLMAFSFPHSRRLLRPCALERLCRVLGQELGEAVQGPGGDDVVGGEPAALGGADAVDHVGQVADGVGVGVDGELDPGVAGGADTSTTPSPTTRLT